MLTLHVREAFDKQQGNSLPKAPPPRIVKTSVGEPSCPSLPLCQALQHISPPLTSNNTIPRLPRNKLRKKHRERAVGQVSASS
eukprot:768475-Hanusia_phi.AAC.12